MKIKEELTKEEMRELNSKLNFIELEMTKMQREHPKAKVVYSFSREQIMIYYPLPDSIKKLDWAINSINTKREEV